MGKSLVKKSRRETLPSKKEEHALVPVGINGSESFPIDSEARRAMIAE